MHATRPRSDSRNRLFEAAKTLIAERGIYGLTARDVYRSVDLPQGSFTFAFPKGLPQLLDELFLVHHAALWDRALEVFGASERPIKPEDTLASARLRLSQAISTRRQAANLYFQLEGLTASPGTPSTARQRVIKDRRGVAEWARAQLYTDAEEGLFDQVFGGLAAAGRAWAVGLADLPPDAMLHGGPDLAKKFQRKTQDPSQQGLLNRQLSLPVPTIS